MQDISPIGKYEGWSRTNIESERVNITADWMGDLHNNHMNCNKIPLQRIMNSLQLSKEVIWGQEVDEKFKRQFSKFRSFLKQYFSVYKLTQEEVIQLETKKELDITQISQFFESKRRELDSKEQLLKMQYLNIVTSYQTSLNIDHDYLSDKCKSLWKTLDELSKQIQSFSPSEKLQMSKHILNINPIEENENFLDNYNLESLLLKEEVEKLKLDNKGFQIQWRDKFKFPSLDSNLALLINNRYIIFLFLT